MNVSYRNLPEEVANEYRRNLRNARDRMRRAEQRLDWLNLHEGLSTDVMDAALEAFLAARDAVEALEFEIWSADADAFNEKATARHEKLMAELEAEFPEIVAEVTAEVEGEDAPDTNENTETDMELKNLTTTVAHVANEAVGTLLVMEQEHGERLAQKAMPILLDVVGQAAVVANGNEPVWNPDVADLLKQTTDNIATWIQEDGDGYPALADHPIGDMTISVGDLAERMVHAVLIAAEEASGESGPADGLFMGLVGRSATREMLGSIIARLTDEPVSRSEVDTLFAEVAGEIGAKLKSLGVSDEDWIHGYA